MFRMIQAHNVMNWRTADAQSSVIQVQKALEAEATWAWRAAFLHRRHQDCRPSWLCSRRKNSFAGFSRWHLLHGFSTTVGCFTTGRAACMELRVSSAPILQIGHSKRPFTAKHRMKAHSREDVQLMAHATRVYAAQQLDRRDSSSELPLTFMQSLHWLCRPSEVRL